MGYLTNESINISLNDKNIANYTFSLNKNSSFDITVKQTIIRSKIPFIDDSDISSISDITNDEKDEKDEKVYLYDEIKTGVKNSAKDIEAKSSSSCENSHDTSSETGSTESNNSAESKLNDIIEHMLHRLDYCEEEKFPEDSQPGLFRKMYNRLVEEIEFEAMNLEFEEEIKSNDKKGETKSLYDNIMDKIKKLSEAFNMNKLPSFFEYIKDVYNDLEELPESQSIFVDMMKKMLVGMFGTIIFPSNNFLSFYKRNM